MVELTGEAGRGNVASMPRAIVLVLVLGIAFEISGCAEGAPTQAPADEPASVVVEPPPAPTPAPERVEPQPPAADPPSENDATKWQRTAKVPTITVDEPVVGTPAIDADIIRRVVRSHNDAIRACYDLAPDSMLAGRIAISFTIGPTGAVTEAKADTPESYPYPEVPKCIADELRTWTFPAPRGGGSVIVSYPFNVDPA